MSHNRSFNNMSIDELCIKNEYDKYRLQAIEGPIMKPFKDYGMKGFDESLYVLAHKIIPGLKKLRASYFMDQIKKNGQELFTRDYTSPSERVKKIVQTKINPATFNVLKSERENLRLERIESIKETGNPLYLSEKIRYAKKSIKDSVNNGIEKTTKYLGSAGQLIRDNAIWITTGLMLAVTGFTGNHWVNQSKIYSKVAEKYVLSHEVGGCSLPLKRDIPEQVAYCTINLTYTPEIEFEINDTKVEFPEKQSSPQAARISIHSIEGTLNDNLSDWNISSFKSVRQDDKKKLALIRNAAMNDFYSADYSLRFQFDPEKTYGYEIGLVISGNSKVQKAVGILESYMDHDIVEKENTEYTKLSIWKWSTIVGAVLTGIIGSAAYRSSRNNRWRRKYYG